MPLDRPEVSRTFDRLDAGNHAMGEAYWQGRTARAELIGELASEMQQATMAPRRRTAFPLRRRGLPHLIGQDAHIRLAFASLGVWDTHVTEGTAKAARRSPPTPGDALATLVKGLGKHCHDTVVVIRSEFGRMVHKNGNGGTDHGHGNVI